MSDNLKRYRAIKQALKQLYPTEPQGNLARHLDTLDGLISGIVGLSLQTCPRLPDNYPMERSRIPGSNGSRAG